MRWTDHRGPVTPRSAVAGNPEGSPRPTTTWPTSGGAVRRFMSHWSAVDWYRDLAFPILRLEPDQSNDDARVLLV